MHDMYERYPDQGFCQKIFLGYDERRKHEVQNNF
jgi:hypothetical protein